MNASAFHDVDLDLGEYAMELVLADSHFTELDKSLNFWKLNFGCFAKVSFFVCELGKRVAQEFCQLDFIAATLAPSID